MERILKEAEETVKGDDLDALKTLIGEQIDLINLINAYRLKRVFHADEDTLRSMMLPIQGRLPKRICEQLYAAPDIAAFIYHAYNNGMDIICQCEYGQSRSAGCAAAILEHFYHSGISVFANYDYCPSQVVYHKIFDALEQLRPLL